MAPIVGVMAMASSTMYGNVKQFGGGNHLVVPNGVLQEYYADPAKTKVPVYWVEALRLVRPHANVHSYLYIHCSTLATARAFAGCTRMDSGCFRW